MRQKDLVLLFKGKRTLRYLLGIMQTLSVEIQWMVENTTTAKEIVGHIDKRMDRPGNSNESK